MDVKLQDLPLLLFVEGSVLILTSIPVNNRPEIGFVVEFGDVDFSYFLTERLRKLFLASTGIRRIHAHEKSEVTVNFQIYHIGTFV